MRNGTVALRGKGEEAQQIERDERRLAIAACCFLTFPSFKDCVVLFGSLVGIPSGIASAVSYAILVIVLLRAIPSVLKRMSWPDLGLFSALLFVLLGSWIANPSSMYSSLFVGLLTMLLTQCLGMYFICRSIRDWEQCWRFMGIASLAILVMQGIILVIPSNSGFLADSYSQSFSYQTLPAAAYYLVRLFKRPKVLTLLLFIASVGLIVASGTRGPLAALAVLAVVLIVLEKRLGVWRIIIAGVIVVVVLFFQDLLTAVLAVTRNVFESFGLSTRILDVLYEGNFFASDERPILVRNVLHLISALPLTGYGIGGDRIAIATAMGGIDEVSGYYAHNFFLECMMQYGLIVGVLIGVAACWLFMRAISVSSGARRAVVLTMLGVGFAPLLVSGSYMGSPLFFMCVALCIGTAQEPETTEVKTEGLKTEGLEGDAADALRSPASR